MLDSKVALTLALARITLQPRMECARVVAQADPDQLKEALWRPPSDNEMLVRPPIIGTKVWDAISAGEYRTTLEAAAEHDVAIQNEVEGRARRKMDAKGTPKRAPRAVSRRQAKSVAFKRRSLDRQVVELERQGRERSLLIENEAFAIMQGIKTRRARPRNVPALVEEFVIALGPVLYRGDVEPVPWAFG
jgi:hypothetical protein